MISEFYENSEIFITGGSGVVGKAAVEKLLRSCNVKRIFLLMRSKKGVCPDDRLKELKNAKIFKLLKERKPNELDKLVAIPGDITLDGFGVSKEHIEIMRNVSVFIHSAATVRFDEPLKKAIRLNVRGTLEALKLAETMINLKIFMHVSTYFSNPYLTYIEDKIYPAVWSWKTAIKMLEDDVSDFIVDSITTKFLGDFPNTYTFTKHLAEQLVNDYRHKLPVAIYRPSIVVSALEEPEPGFTESMTGIMGLGLIWGTGLLQALQLKDASFRFDITPLDTGTKTLLMFAALKAQLPREKFKEATPIGKFSSVALIPSTNCRQYGEEFNRATKKYPLEKSLWIPNVTMTESLALYWLIVIFQQLLPALLIDGLLILFRKKPFMMFIQRKMLVARQAMFFFYAKEYANDGVTDFEEMRKAGEGNEFNLNKELDYIENPSKTLELYDVTVQGFRRILLNEPDSSIERCRRILKAKIIVYNILRGYIAYSVICFLFHRAKACIDL